MHRIRPFILLALLVLLAPLISLAQVYGADLVTEQYDVNIKVHEDYSWDVEEIIQMNFLARHHGIYRYIPYVGHMYYSYQGQEYASPYRIKFSNVSIPNYKYEKSNKNSSMVLQIGDENVYVEGLHIYKIFYKAEAYQKPTEGFAQFYWGILPTDWNAPIEKGSFSIEFPKAIDPEKIEFIAGAYGATHTDWVDWSLEGDRIIKGQLNTGLNPGDGVTIRVLLDEGYFPEAKNNNWMFYPMVVLIFIAPLLCFYLWRRYGVDPAIVKTVEFYPPDGVDPAQASYLIDSTTESKDIVGVIIYLANEGYLTIEENGKKFTLIKAKDIPASVTGHKRTVFNGIFDTDDEVTEKDLKKYFPTQAIAAQKQIKDYYKNSDKHRIFTKASFRARIFGLLIAGLPIFALSVFGIGYSYGIWEDMWVALFFLWAILLTYVFHMYTYDRRNTLGRFKRFWFSLSGVLLTLFFMITFLFVINEWNGLLTWGIVALVSSLLCLIFVTLMKKRTAYGAEMLGKLLGFKEFLKVAELDRIKLLVEADPSYFYATLPYAYVFGLTRVWAKKFEKITMDSPDWYTNTTGAAFSHTLFMKSFNSYAGTMDKISVPKSSGSGGGGGGGFSGGGGSSGGGMGGGGGGGW